MIVLVFAYLSLLLLIYIYTCAILQCAKSQEWTLSRVLDDKIVLVYYYSPECNYCIQFDPVWDEVVKQLQYSPINCMKINAQNVQQIDQYPTVMLYPAKGGKPQMYNGIRESQNIIQWLYIINTSGC